MSSLVRWPIPTPRRFPAAGPSRPVAVPTYPGLIQRRPLAANTAVSGAAGVTTLSVTPTGQVENDWMLAFVSSVGGANTISSASGWTEVGTQVTQATTTVGSLWKKKAGASEAGPYQWDGTASLRMAIIVVAYLGADPTDVVDAGQVSSEGATAQQLDHNSLTPGAARNWHILATCSNSTAPDDGAVTFTQPAAYGEQAEVASGHATNANVHMALADRELLDTSAIGVQSVTIAGGVNRALVGFEVVIRVPAAASPSGAASGQQRTDGATAAAKGAAGAAQGATRISGQAAGAKTAAGTAQGPARTTGAATIRKQAAGAATGPTRTTGAAAGVKQATGAASGQQRTAGVAGFTPAGPSGAATGQQHTSGTATGAKQASGAASGPTRTSGSATGRKQATAPTTGQQRTTGTAAAAKSTQAAAAGPTRTTGAAATRKQATGTANGEQRTAGLSAGGVFLGPNGPARGQQHTAGAATGRKGAATAAAGAQRTAGLAAGIHRAAGAASGQQHTSGASAGIKGGRGAAAGQQRSSGTAAFTTVPPPRWVEGATEGTGQIEGIASGTGQIEGVLVGTGLVEGSGGI